MTKSFDVSQLTSPTGSSLVGYKPQTTERTVAAKLNDIVSVKDFGAVGDGVTDDTAAVQAAIDLHTRVHFPTGVYVINSVNITKTTTIVCHEGVTFLRKANADIRQSYWNAGVAMFEVAVQGITLTFDGAPTFDGNNPNQLPRTGEPSGFAIKIQPPASPVASSTPTELRITGGAKFVRGTSGYLAIRGDDVNRRYLTRCVLESSCTFEDTLHGIGKDDPIGITALGYQPDYILVQDYVHLHTHDVRMRFLQDCPLGFYAAVGIRVTYNGASASSSGRGSVWLHGTSYFEGLGRDARKYDDANNYVYNNGIGVVDLYGNAESIYVENVLGVNNRNVTIRAKASAENYTVLSAVLRNCWRGLQVSPSTTGTSETNVYVGNVTSYGGTIPQLEFVGTTSVDRLRTVNIGAFYQLNTPTNPELLATNTNGVVSVRNTTRATLSAINIVGGSPTCGISLAGNNTVTVDSPTIRSCAAAGIQCDGNGNLRVLSSYMDTLGGAAINVQNSAANFNLQVVGGESAGSVDYGILNLNTAANTSITGFRLSAVSGLSRGFYTAPGSRMAISNASIISGVTTPVFYSSAGTYSEVSNSWTSSVRYGTSSTITIGTAKVGDIVYNTAPIAGGTIGWVCTTAGTPGTWKTFATISA